MSSWHETPKSTRNTEYTSKIFSTEDIFLLDDEWWCVNIGLSSGTS